MPFNLLLENGDALLLENGDNLLLESAPDSVPLLILFSDSEMNPSQPDEETTPLYTDVLTDENGAALEANVIESMLLQVFDEAADVTLRETQSVLNENDVTITYGATTTLQWLLQVGDTRLADLTKDKGNHQALFEYAWDSQDSGSLTDPFSVTEGSATVTVTIPSHGLTGDDNHLFFIEAAKVGGICLNGSQYVSRIVDEDTVEITGRVEATSTITGGGEFDYLVNSKVLKHLVKFVVFRREPIC